MADSDGAGNKSWWSTLPGVLTALAAAITAIGGLVAVLVQAGLIGSRAPTAAAPTVVSMPVKPGNASTAAPPAAPPVVTDVAPAGPAYTAVRVTSKGGSAVMLRPSATILGATLPLQDGQEVGFERIASVEIVQPWDGSLVLLLADGRRLEASAANLPLSGTSDLGNYLAMLSDLRRIEFIRPAAASATAR